MILDLADRVNVAYKKLKQMVYFERHPLTLRRRMAEFECDADFEERVQIVAKIAKSKSPHKTPQFKKWIEEINCEVIPKSVVGLAKSKEDRGSFVSNVTSGPVHRVDRVNYIFDGPVELHLLSVLWLMTEGPEYDRTLSNHCSGSRLHQFVGNDEDHSAYLFKKYHELYSKWRDSGIKKARDLLSEDRQSVCVVGLDVQEYYYRIQLDWETLRTQIKRPVPKGPFQAFLMQRRLLGAKLFKCIEEVCKSYREKLNPFLAVTHPDLPEAATCLPIGLCASPVIANWYLKEFDEAVLESVRPAYYGRYVDDILLVVAMQKPPDESDPITSFMDQVLVRPGILKLDQKNNRFELNSRPGLYLQQKKCNLQYFDAEHSIAGLEKFQKKIEENASDFALLPVDSDDSPVAQVAYDLLYDGSVNKFRSVKAVAENRWELATHLAKQTQLHMMTTANVDKRMSAELMQFFKGRNAIDFWDMWERVISFFVVADDLDSRARFVLAIQSEIDRIEFSTAVTTKLKSNPSTTSLLKKSLSGHLESCLEMGIALCSTSNEETHVSIQYLRKSNLIRHHLVAIPLLNYTNYDGSLAAPVAAAKLVIDDRKVSNSPRFVRFDECLGFANSGCAQTKKKDAIALAKEVYRKFHGSELEEVTSELVGLEDEK